MFDKQQYRKIFSEKKICVIIPTFNNGGTVANVIKTAQQFTHQLLVVNDGATDETLEIISELKVFQLISYAKNQGKGFALKTAFRKAMELGFNYALTIDADGQHYPEDMAVLLDKLAEHPGSLLIGSRNISAEGMPSKNTFANKFSNFWFWIETGQKLPDTQSGFRLYPIFKYKESKFFTSKYEFEIEILVRSAWSGIEIIPVPIRVYYPPESERISHFKPFRDFTRISILNTLLVLLTLFYILPLKAFKYLKNNKLTKVIREQISNHNENRQKVATAIGFGVFMGIVPIWGLQMLTAVFLAHILKLNKILVLIAANISLPPLIPFIIYFSFLLGGFVLQNENRLTAESVAMLKDQIMEGNFWDTLVEFGYSFYQYIVGSFVLAIALGMASGLLTYFLLKKYKPVENLTEK